MIQNPGLEVSLNYIIIAVVIVVVIINQLFSTIFFSFFLLLMTTIVVMFFFFLFLLDFSLSCCGFEAQVPSTPTTAPEGPSSSWILILDNDETDNQYPILMHDKSHCIVPNTRISSLSTVVSAAAVVAAAAVAMAGSEE